MPTAAKQRKTRRNRRSNRSRRPRLEPLEHRMLLATIQGSLFEDMNADGDIAADPPLNLADVTIYLDENNNGVLDEDEISTVTATDGTYQFPNLDVGAYTVAQVVPKNWLQTSPTPAAAPSQLGDVLRDFDLAGLEAGPVGMALNNIADVLYVVDIDMGIYPVDPTTGQTPAGATDFTKPTSGTWDITIDSAGNFWGVDPAADLVVKFRQSQSDSTQAEILQQFPAPNPQTGDPYPVGIAWDNTDNTLWIADRDFQEIYHVDPATGELLPGTIPAPGTIGTLQGLAFDGQHLWVNRFGESNLTFEIDRDGQILRQFIPPAANQNLPTGLAFGGQDAQGRQSLWLTQYHDRRLIQADITSPGTHQVNLATIDQTETCDFGNFELGAVSGTVRDTEGNPLDGWRVYLDTNSNGELEGWESHAVTSAGGSYTIEGLLPGQQTLAAELREPGWAFSDPSSGGQQITLDASGAVLADVDFAVSAVGDFRPIGGEIEVAAEPAQMTSVNSLGMDDNGNYVVVWQETVDGNQDIFARWYNVAGPTTEAILVNSSTDGTQLDPVVAMADNGSSVVVWTSKESDTRHVLGQRFSPDGQRDGGEFIVFSGNKKTGGYAKSVAMDTNGDFAVLYGKSTNPGYFATYSLAVQRYDALGTAQGGVIKIDADVLGAQANIAMNDAGEFVVVWEGSFSTLATIQRYGASGSALGSEIVITGEQNYATPVNVAMDTSGGFAVAWTTGGGKIYGADGQLLYDFAFDADSRNPAIAMQDNGEFVMTWVSDDGDVFAQRFTAAGISKEDQFLVGKATTSGAGGISSLGVDASGNVAIAWRGRSDGVYAQQYQSVIISNNPPIATDDPATIEEDLSATVNVLANDTDADGDPLHVSSITQGANGTVVDNEDGSLTYTPDPDYHGTDSFTYTVGDGRGGTDTATVNVTITPVNDAPVAAHDVVSTDAETPITIDVLANDSDPDGDTLSVDSVSLASNGTVTLSQGVVEYTPNAGFTGTDSFTYTVIEGSGGSDTATVHVTVTEPNDAPVANDDTYSTDEDGQLVISSPGILANDTDGDGDPLTPALASEPSHGTLTLNPDGSFTYDPDLNFNGSDSFTYKSDDGTELSNTATVSLTVNAVNDAPVAVDDSAATDQDTEATINVLANDTDVDGDPLEVIGATDGAHGTVVVNADYTVTYTPDQGFYGTDSFTYTLEDGNGGTDTGTVTIQVGGPAIFVFDIRFDSQRDGRDWQAVVEVHDDTGAPVVGATVTVEFKEVVYTGQSDADGIFRTGWARNVKNGTYYANVVDLVMGGYTWDHDLDLEDDTDGDTYIDDVLVKT